MARDWTDELLERWGVVRPGLDMDIYQVTARVARLGQLLARRQAEVFSRFGLNRGEVGVLSALRVSGPPHRLSPTRLFKGLMLSSAGMTARIDRLEKRGLVERLPDPNDRRGVLVELTEEGRRLLEEAVSANTESERQLLAGLTPEQVSALGDLLRELLRVLEPGIALET